MRESLEAKYAEKICGIWQNMRRIYAAYANMRHIFPHISGICKFE